MRFSPATTTTTTSDDEPRRTMDSDVVDASPGEIGAGAGVETYASKLRGASSMENNGEVEEAKPVPIRAPVSEDEESNHQGGEAFRGAPAEDEQEVKAPVLVPIRAPLSVDADGEADGNDGNASSGSGESFDSALERIATSSTASFDSVMSPKASAAADTETARVMPKALITEDDEEHSSSSTSSSSSNEVVPSEPGSDVSPEDVVVPESDGLDSDTETPVEQVDGVGTVLDDEPTPEVAAADEPAVDEQTPEPETQPEEPQVEEPAVEEEVEEAPQVQEPESTGDVEEDVSVPVVEPPVTVGAEDNVVTEREVDNVVTEPEFDNVVTEPEFDNVVTEPDVVVEPEAEPEPDVVAEPEPEAEAEPEEAEDETARLADTDSDNDQESEVESLEDEEAIQNSLFVGDMPKSGSSSGPSLGSAGPSLPSRPSIPVRALPSLESAPRAAPSGNGNGNAQAVAAAQPNPTVVEPPAAAVVVDNPANGDAPDENQETREKLQMIRVKFLRLAHRLGQSSGNVVVAQVLYRLGLAEQLRGGRSSGRNSAFSFDRASALAEELEAAGDPDVDFTCTIMVLGKTGVGKSATINSLFDERKTETNAFSYSTDKVTEITGTVHGIKLRVIDTPGLLVSASDQRYNEKIMAQAKKFIKKSPPDIVLYFDRLDIQCRDYGDLPLLRTITETFGAAIWFNAIVVFTHASSAPPEGPNGYPLSYEMFVAQRSHLVQQTIRQAAGDMRLMNPVSLVENHSACRVNRAGERVLPNGQVWKPQLLLLCFASKILAEANSLLKLQDSSPGKPFMRSKVPPLPFLLSSLLQSRQPLKLPEESAADDDETDDDVEVDESDDEEEFDNLPPFRRLTKEEVDQLDKKNRAAYFEELRERERLFQKKQWKEELRRRKEARKRAASASKEDYPAMDDGYDDADGKSAAVPVPLPDMALPPTFDSDNPSHRYRYLETANQWLVRPVLETHGWDHDSGYDGLNVEKMFVVGKVPASISGQVTKDKKEANVTMECAASMKHGEGKFTQVGFDVQSVGKDMSYTMRSETRFNNFRKNKTIAGLALTKLGDTLAAGMKLEDRLMIGKRLKVVLNGGALTGKGDVAYGGTMEMSLRDKDFPICKTLTTLGFSVMNWHGDLAVGGNLQSQFMVGRTMVVARSNLNNRGAGLITIKASSSEQLQMALIGLVPLVRAIIGHKLFAGSSSSSGNSQAA